MISKFHIHHFLISYYKFHIFPMLCFLTTLDLGQCIIDKTTPYLEHKKNLIQVIMQWFLGHLSIFANSDCLSFLNNVLNTFIILFYFSIVVD